jgi:integrase
MLQTTIPHLYLRGSKYYFRYQFPANTHRLLGIGEIKRSLGTLDKGTAKAATRFYANRAEALVRVVMEDKNLTRQKIDTLVREFFRVEMDDLQAIVDSVPDLKDFNIEQQADMWFEDYKGWRRLLEKHQYGKGILNQAKALVASTGIEPGETSKPDINYTCQMIVRALAEQRRIGSELLGGNPEGTAIQDPFFKDVTPRQATIKTGPAVERLAKKYIETKSKADWTPKTLLDQTRVLNWFLEHVGKNTPIGTVHKDMVRDFRDDLFNIPANAAKKKEFKELGFKALVQTKTKAPKISKKTVKKYYELAKTFLNWCVDEGYLENAPTVKSNIGLGDLQDAKPPFSPGQLTDLFASPNYTGFKSPKKRHLPGDLLEQRAHYWVPLIALHSGMRISEIVQLAIEDVREIEGVLLFDLKLEGKHKKKLKTKSAKRLVPVHPILLELGFEAYLEEQSKDTGQGYLFPDINSGKAKNPSDTFGKWFSNYLKLTKVKTPKTSFHSFRHNFKDALHHAGITDSVQDALMGHSNKSVGAIYGSGIPVTALAAAMEKVNFSIDLGHLIVTD